MPYCSFFFYKNALFKIIFVPYFFDTGNFFEKFVNFFIFNSHTVAYF